MNKIIASNRFLKFKKHSPAPLQIEIDKHVKLIANNPNKSKYLLTKESIYGNTGIN